MGKKVAVIIRQTPFRTIRNKEGLRMCVGSTLIDNEVTVVFLGPGVISAGKVDPKLIGLPELESEFEAFRLMNVVQLAEIGAVERYGVELRDQVRTAGMAEIARVLAECDVVIPW